MINAFYFILKALFVHKIFKFLSRLFGYVGKTAWLERYRWLQNSWRHYLVYKQLEYTPSISQSKGNQTMKFGQLIEYSKINIFLQKLFGKWDREASSRPLFSFSFSKKLNMRWKQVVCSLVLIYFDSPQLGIQ